METGRPPHSGNRGRYYWIETFDIDAEKLLIFSPSYSVNCCTVPPSKYDRTEIFENFFRMSDFVFIVYSSGVEWRG